MIGLGMGLGFQKSRKPIGAGYDPAAAAYFAASIAVGATPNTTQKNAVNKLAIDQKAAGIWSSIKAQYPCLGISAAGDAINLSNPATNTITWHGTVTHNANGITGDGSTGYGDTGFSTASTTIVMGAYSRAIGAGSVNLCIGNSASDGIITEANSDVIYSGIRFWGVFSAGTRLLAVNAAGMNGLTYTNGVVDSDVITGQGFNPPSRNFFILGDDNGDFSTSNFAFVFIGTTSLTAIQHASLASIVQAFQTTLSRQV